MSRIAATFWILLFILQLCTPAWTLALPADGKVVAGQATIQHTSPSSLSIQQATDKAILNWNSFSIGANEAVRFYQPSLSSIALNRVTGIDPSVILGQLQANGRLFLVNPNGILFGAGAQINVGGLLASTLQIKDSDFMAGRYLFAQDPLKGLSTVINKGTIHVSDHGFVYLIAPGVANDGVILANLGSVVLGSAQKATIDLMGDGLINYTLSDKVASQVKGPDGKPLTSAVSNSGVIQADGGKVILSARASGDVFESVINQSGVVRARSLVNHAGVIRLEGGDPVQNTGVLGWQNHLGEVKNADGRVINTGTLDVSAAEAGAAPGEVTVSGQMVGIAGSILARGAENANGGNVLATSSGKTIVLNGTVIDNSGVGNSSAGNAVIWSDKDTLFGGSILAQGGAIGGNGGHVEVSGHENLGFVGQINALAPQGTTGSLLLDPANITVATGGGATLAQVDQFSDTPGATQTIAPATINAAAANVTLQANTDITITNAIAMTNNGVGITMQAGRDINVNAGVSTTNGSISMTANDSTAIAANRTAGTTGDITFAAGANLSSGAGNISLTVDPSAAAPFSPGSITTVRNLTTTTGNVSINSPNTVSLSGTVNAGSGTVTINANTDGAGAQAFTMNAGSSITTTNATANAVQINVNAAAGGTGTAALQGITTGGAGTVTVATNTGGNTTGGDITTSGAITTGNLSMSSPNNVTLAAAVNAGGTVTINANTDGAGAQAFTMNAGSSITTTDTSANAVRINVNAAGGGTGTAALRDIATGNGGTITVATNTGGNATGGDITQTAGTLLNVGSGTVNLSTSTAATSNIGAAGTPILTTAGTINATSGGAGIFIQESDGATISGATTAANGNIQIVSTTGDLTVGGNITAGGTGNVTLTATAGDVLRTAGTVTGNVVTLTAGGGDGDIGTLAQPIQTAATNIAFTGAGTGDVFITESNGATLNASSTGTGNITVTNTAGNLIVGGNVTTGGSGTVTLTNNAANAVLTVNGGTTVTGPGGVTYTSDDMALTGATNAGTAIAGLQPSSVGRGIDLGTNTAGTLGLTSAELNTVTAGTLRVGSLTSGNLNVSAAIAPTGASTLSLLSGGTITQGAAATITETNLSVSSVGSTTLDLGVAPTANSATTNVVSVVAANVTGPGSSFSIRGSGGAAGLTVGTVDGVSGVTTSNGAISIAAAGGGSTDHLTVNQPIASNGGNIGLVSMDHMFVNANVNAGSGTVTVNTNTDLGQIGNFTMAAGTSITTTNSTASAVQITLNNSDSGTANAVLNNITTGNGGTITVTASPGAIIGGSITQLNTGLLDVGSGTVALSTQPNVATGIGTAAQPIRTTAGTVTASAGTNGVFVQETDGANMSATATTTGPIYLGTQSGTLTVNAATSTGSGDITLDGGAAGNVAVNNTLTTTGNVRITAPGGTVSETGSITATTLGVRALGPVTLNGANDVTTVAGNVTGAGNAFSYNDATAVTIGSVTALAAPPVAFAAVDGISTNNGAITVTTTNGALTVSNTPAAQDVNAGTSTVALTAGGVNQLLTVTGAVTGTGGVTYTADNMTLTGATTATGAIATLQPNTAGQLVNLGGVDAVGTLGLTDAELDTVTAGTLRVGRANSGNMTISAALTPGGTNTLSLISGAAVTETAGSTITTTNLRVSSVGAVDLTQNNDVTTLAGSVTGAGNGFGFVDTNGFAVGTVDTVVGLTTNNGTTQLRSTTGNIDINQPINVGTGNVGLQAAAGAITQSGSGTITADGLGIRAQNSVSLTLANDVNTIAANITGAGNSFTYNDATGVTIGSIPAIGAIAAIDGITTSNGPITVTTTNGPLTVNNTPAVTDVNAGTSTVALTAGGANQLLTVTGTVTGTGGVTFTADDMTLAGATNAGAAIATLQPNTAGRAIDLGTNTAGTLGLTDAELDTVTAGTLRVGRNNSGNMTISAALTPGGTNTLSLISGGSVTENVGGTITTTNLAVNSVGAVTLNQANDVTTIAANVTGAGNAFSYNDATALTIGTVDGLNGVTTNNGDISLQTGAALSINQALNAGTANVGLNGGGAVTQGAAGIITANQLNLRGPGPFTLTNASNDVNAVGANTTGGIQLTDVDDLTVGSVSAVGTVAASSGITATGNVALTTTNGGALTISQPITTTNTGTITLTNAGTLALNANLDSDGAVTQNGVGAITTTGTRTVTTTNDAVTLNQAVTLGGDLTISTGTGAINFNSTINGGGNRGIL